MSAVLSSKDPFVELDNKALSSYPPVLAKLLAERGISTKEEAEEFLKPDFDTHTHDPFLMKDMKKTVDRILKAVADNQRIVVYSDYDTDGIPGGVIMHDFFKKIGYQNFENYIPDRHNDGFGLNSGAIESLSGKGAKLIITVDCGIANVGEVKLARDLGMDIIITDHHEAGVDLPDAFSIVDPKQPGCDYPNKNICGAGVAFKLIQALVFSLRENPSLLPAKDFILPSVGWEKWLLDMVGIATLSDMVPLVGENRAFAHYGLVVLRKTPRVGIVRLLSVLRIKQRFLSEDDVGFMISPRINAASRMGVPMDAFLLLTAKDDVEAEKHIKHLDGINNERKGVVASIVKELKKIIEERGSDRSVIVMGNPKWRPSLLGLACNKLVEEHKKAVFLWGRGGKGDIKGSCRAPEHASVISIMENAEKGTFVEYGGHHASGGFSVSDEAVHFLEDRLDTAFGKSHVTEEKIDLNDKNSLFIDDVNFSMYKLIEKLGPFGVGNQKPVFFFKSVNIEKVEFFGKEKQHLKILLRKTDNSTLPLIYFFVPSEKMSLFHSLKAGDNIDFSAHIEYSFFGYRAELRLRLVDFLS